MKSFVSVAVGCVAAADDSTSMLQTGSHQALLDRASQSTINNVIAEFLSLPVERRQALLKLADTNEPDASLAEWLSLPVQQRNELIELARSGSVEGSTQMKGKKKKTCTDQLNDKVDSEVKKFAFCKKDGLFGDGADDDAAVSSLVAGAKLQDALDDEGLTKCDDVQDVFDWCMEACYEKLDGAFEGGLREGEEDKEPFCRRLFFGDSEAMSSGSFALGSAWSESAAKDLVAKVCPPEGSKGQKVAFHSWCTTDADEQ